jgi:hypothetical protein
MPADALPAMARSVGDDLGVLWIVFGDAPGEVQGHGDERVQDDEDCFEATVIGFNERRAVSGIQESLWLRLHGMMHGMRIIAGSHGAQ